MPDPDNRERVIFDAMVDLATAAEREAYLDQTCGGDSALRAAVETLLRAHESAGGFLGDINPAEPSVAPSEAPISEGPGTRIGRYKLLERIGEGGFGVVYLAEQEEPVRRRVALKIIKLGMDTRAVVARFEAERQALAMMEHPNIAKVLDGGVTATGRPYFVMELVRGIPITRFCDEQRLTTHERLKLFMPVCHAVQHAHQKGIIHRDLKPSNMLVTMHDDRPVPCVIDFGIAKATEHRLTEKTLLTRFHQFIGTPAYMSPEQTGISGLDIDTRSDIYSLGVVLYELLAGRPPFDTQELLAAGYAEIQRTIREKDPLVPSHRLTTLNREEQTTTAGRRSTDLTRLVGHVRGDLDRIVMKCLQKDRTRRYETANGLAMDVSRFLNNEPVLARPDTLSYRMAKFVRRHRAPVALVTLMFLVLLAGLAGTITQARRATRQAVLAEVQRRQASEQRDFALRQLSRAEAINELNGILLFDAGASGRAFTVAELLARAERLLDRPDVETAENRAELLVAIGWLHQRQDEHKKALPLLTRAYELSRQSSDHAIRAKAASALAEAIAGNGEHDRAEKLIQEALAELGDEPQFALHRVFSLMHGGAVAGSRGDALTAVERMQAAQRVLRESGHGSALLESRVARGLARYYQFAGRSREASAVFAEAFAQLSAFGREDTETAGTLLNNWALALEVLGQPLEAERNYRRSIAISSGDGTEQGAPASLLINLARALLQLERLPEAAAYAERATEKARGSGQTMLFYHTLNMRAHIYREQGNLDRCAELLAEFEPWWKQNKPGGNLALIWLESHHSLLSLARGDATEAAAASDRAIALVEASPQRADTLPIYLIRRADVLMQLRRFNDARADAERALTLHTKTVGPDARSSWSGQAYLRLGRALVAQEKLAEARAAFASAFEHLLPTFGAEHPRTKAAAAGAKAL